MLKKVRFKKGTLIIIQIDRSFHQISIEKRKWRTEENMRLKRLEKKRGYNLIQE